MSNGFFARLKSGLAHSSRNLTDSIASVLTKRKLDDAALERALRARIGTEADVLIEQPGFGRSEHYAPVSVAAGAVPGAIARVRLTGVTADRLIGTAA